MVQPQAPKHQTKPWQPSIDPSDSDYSDEQQAASQYDGYYGGSPNTTPAPSGSGSGSSPGGPYPVPTLKMAYTTAPDFIPYGSPASGSGGSPPAITDSFSIELSELMTAENSCLSAVSASIDDYKPLVSAVNNAVGSDSIYGQNIAVYSSGQVPTYSGFTQSNGTGGYQPDVLDDEAKDFAKAINPQMQQLLQAVGNAIEAMGTFTALLNNAGQMYTETDSQSAFPPAYLMQGQTNSLATGVTPPPPTSG